MKVIHMIVNGTPVELAVREDECLTDTLRQRLGLTSVKKGCGVGECGACTVLLDGKATNSCIYLTLWADGREIITVEGLRAKNGCLHPVQQAFVDEAAVQCGFCTPGFILTARDELRKLISGHLCRCTGYENILNAVERVVGVNAK